MRNLKIENPMTKIFVDDLNGGFSALPKGTQYADGKLIINAEKAEEEKEVPDDKSTMKVIRDIVNDIDDMIVMTADVPTNHGNNRVPMLDVEVWIDENDNKAYYSFYEKRDKASFRSSRYNHKKAKLRFKISIIKS